MYFCFYRYERFEEKTEEKFMIRIGRLTGFILLYNVKNI